MNPPWNPQAYLNIYTNSNANNATLLGGRARGIYFPLQDKTTRPTEVRDTETEKKMSLLNPIICWLKTWLEVE